MGEFKPAILTNAGAALVLDMMADPRTTQIEYIEIQTGKGVYTGSENLTIVTSLKSYQQTFPIGSITRNRVNNSVELTSLFNNSAVTDRYDITEVGIIAQNKLNPVPIFYGIALALTPDPMPAYSGPPGQTIRQKINIFIPNGNQNEVTIIPGGAVPAGTVYSKEESDARFFSANTNLSIMSQGYGTCDTAADAPIKAVNIPDFKLKTGSHIWVKFTNSDTSALSWDPYLNVNNTGAYKIRYYYNEDSETYAGISVGMISSSALHQFTFDGTNWVLVNSALGNGMHLNDTLNNPSGVPPFNIPLYSDDMTIYFYNLQYSGSGLTGITVSIDGGTALSFPTYGLTNTYFKLTVRYTGMDYWIELAGGLVTFLSVGSPNGGRASSLQINIGGPTRLSYQMFFKY